MANPNPNQTFDYGIMQINSVHLARYARAGVTEQALRDDACTNIAVGAHLLRGHYQHTGDWIAAMERYHSRTPARAAVYRRALARSAHWLARRLPTSKPDTNTATAFNNR